MSTIEDCEGMEDNVSEGFKSRDRPLLTNKKTANAAPATLQNKIRQNKFTIASMNKKAKGRYV